MESLPRFLSFTVTLEVESRPCASGLWNRDPRMASQSGSPSRRMGQDRHHHGSVTSSFFTSSQICGRPGFAVPLSPSFPHRMPTVGASPRTTLGAFPSVFSDPLTSQLQDSFVALTRLPRIVEPGTRVGEVAADVCHGLLRGCPVFVALGDLQASVFESVRIDRGGLLSLHPQPWQFCVSAPRRSCPCWSPSTGLLQRRIVFCGFPSSTAATFSSQLP